LDGARLGQVEAILQQQSCEMAANVRQVDKLSSRVRLLGRDQQVPVKQVSSRGGTSDARLVSTCVVPGWKEVHAAIIKLSFCIQFRKISDCAWHS
jgi:hypothetical protein